MAKIDGVKVALEKDDPAAIKQAVDGYPACADDPPVAVLPTQATPHELGCLAQIATAVGSKRGFSFQSPDQAAAIATTIVLVRDNRGDWMAHPDSWLTAIKTGKGPGPDALRLAVARKMAEVAPIVGKKLDDEKDQRAAMKAIAQSIPGACPAYWMLGTGADPKSLPVEHSSEHAACVQHDLQRREGPGASYGDGVIRALEGSLALWRETERSLRIGLPNTSDSSKLVLDGKMKTIEAATQAIATTKLATNNTSEATTFLGDVHAEAGIILWKDAGAKDGGPDGGPTDDTVRRPIPLKH